MRAPRITQDDFSPLLSRQYCAAGKNQGSQASTLCKPIQSPVRLPHLILRDGAEIAVDATDVVANPLQVPPGVENTAKSTPHVIVKAQRVTAPGPCQKALPFSSARAPTRLSFNTKTNIRWATSRVPRNNAPPVLGKTPLPLGKPKQIIALFVHRRGQSCGETGDLKSW